MYWGKIIGAVGGLVVGHGLIGGLAGLAAGYFVDRHFTKPGSDRPRNWGGFFTPDRQVIFSRAVVALAAKLAKIDGPVTREEIDAFKAAFLIPDAERAGIGALYDQAREDPGGYEIHAEALAQAFADDVKTKSQVLEALQRIALADGPLHPEEDRFLRRVAEILGFVVMDQAADSFADGEDPYAVLGITRDASFPEVKAAWRRLTLEHHPDTLMAKGMSSEQISTATQTMASINAAYDRIRVERGEA